MNFAREDACRAIETIIEEMLDVFLARLNDKVKSCGRQTLIWEGFSPVGVDKLPRDMIVMPYHMRNYPPHWLVKDGYSLINASAGLYVVHSWPKPELKKIYEWNSDQFERRDAAWKTIVLPPSAPVLGAQMCSWEQAESAELPTLRERLAVMSERLWNPGFDKGFAEFLTRLNSTDRKLTVLLGDEDGAFMKKGQGR